MTNHVAISSNTDEMSDAKQILHARAQRLSQPRESVTVAAESLDLLEFRLANERYALEIQYVREVHPFKELTPLPCTPPFVIGISNVRGRITPVIDIKKFFDLPDQGVADLHSIILVHGHGLEFGLLADAIVGVRAVPMAELQPSLATLTGIRSEYLKGVTAERLVVLDLARLLADPNIVVREEVGN